MSKCEHDNFDEYFGKCSDCGAGRETVLAEQFREELQGVYGKMLEALGTESGDIEPMQAVRIEELEIKLANEVASWLNDSYESGE